jgi:hypothetical protein
MNEKTNVDPTTLTTGQKLKDIARALAPVAIVLGVGIACGVVIEKIKSSDKNDTTEA